jgi:hypothetical protein
MSEKLGPFERAVEQVHRTHVGASLDRLVELCRQAGIPASDVRSYWKKKMNAAPVIPAGLAV